MPLLVFLLPYTQINAWDMPLATIALLLFYKQRDPENFLKRIGLKIPPRQLVASLLTAGLAGLLFSKVIYYLIGRADFQLDRTHWSIGLRSRPIFQALNEEIVFRALLLGTFLKVSPNLRLQTSMYAAAVFALAHFAFYYLKDAEMIGTWALLSYFFFGVICNLLFFKTGNVALSYALHLAWNFTRFSGDYLKEGQVIREGATINYLEGWPVLAVGLGVTSLVILVWTRKGLREFQAPPPLSGSAA